MDNIKIDYDLISERIEGQLLSVAGDTPIEVDQERQFVKIKTLDPKKIYFVVSYGSASVSFGQSVLTATITAITTPMRSSPPGASRLRRSSPRPRSKRLSMSSTRTQATARYCVQRALSTRPTASGSISTTFPARRTFAAASPQSPAACASSARR